MNSQSDLLVFPSTKGHKILHYQLIHHKRKGILKADNQELILCNLVKYYYINLDYSTYFTIGYSPSIRQG